MVIVNDWSLIFALGSGGFNKFEGMKVCYDNDWRKVPDKWGFGGVL